jgi:hypothetical protein
MRSKIRRHSGGGELQNLCRAGRDWRGKELLGIDEDYYLAVPPDPTDEEMVSSEVTSQ